MGYERIKTEHTGAKNGGGAWMTRAEAKETSRRRRRQIDEQDATEAHTDERLHTEPHASSSTRSTELLTEPWTDPDPQPGDFDIELDRARPDQIEIHDGFRGELSIQQQSPPPKAGGITGVYTRSDPRVPIGCRHAA